MAGMVSPGNACPHRAMDMLYGIPEEEGLRCAYHGWLFDFDGQCIDQPAEPPESRFKDKVQIQTYSAEELGDLVWAYIGPSPVPLLPRWDLLVWPNVTRIITSGILPCNWLQTVDNGLDQTHVGMAAWVLRLLRCALGRPPVGGVGPGPSPETRLRPV